VWRRPAVPNLRHAGNPKRSAGAPGQRTPVRRQPASSTITSTTSRPARASGESPRDLPATYPRPTRLPNHRTSAGCPAVSDIGSLGDDARRLGPLKGLGTGSSMPLTRFEEPFRASGGLAGVMPGSQARCLEHWDGDGHDDRRETTGFFLAPLRCACGSAASCHRTSVGSGRAIRKHASRPKGRIPSFASGPTPALCQVGSGKCTSRAGGSRRGVLFHPTKHHRTQPSKPTRPKPLHIRQKQPPQIHGPVGERPVPGRRWRVWWCARG